MDGSVVAAAVLAVLDPEVVVTMALASVFGLLLGAIPGLTATMGAALLVPISFFLDPLPAIGAVIAVATSAIFAGDLPGALLRIPGTPASAAYVDDAHALTLAGRARLGLGVGLVSAVVGGLIGVAVLTLAAPALARFALGFSSVEYFWLATLGLSCAVIVSEGTVLRGLASLFLGLFVACVGVDTVAGHPRFTFGSTDLMGGVSFIPALIGLFALSEIIRNLSSGAALSDSAIPPQVRGDPRDGVVRTAGRHWFGIVRGGTGGTLIGALPGAGADIAAWIAYAVAKKTSRAPERFGRGSTEGIAEAGAANNGALAGAWVPALVFGIPGDTITAIAIGVLLMKGLQPGPTIFLFQPQLMYSVFAAFLFANLLLLPLGLLAIGAAKRMLTVPQRVLLPVILLFCVVGSFAVEGSIYGVVVMAVFGVVGWLMQENDIPLAPAILGIVLGGMIEFNFVTSLLKSDGDLMVFVSRPIGAVLAVVTIIVWSAPLVALVRGRARRAASTPELSAAGPPATPRTPTD